MAACPESLYRPFSLVHLHSLHIHVCLHATLLQTKKHLIKKCSSLLTKTTTAGNHMYKVMWVATCSSDHKDVHVNVLISLIHDKNAGDILSRTREVPIEAHCTTTARRYVDHGDGHPPIVRQTSQEIDDPSWGKRSNDTGSSGAATGCGGRGSLLPTSLTLRIYIITVCTVLWLSRQRQTHQRWVGVYVL